MLAEFMKFYALRLGLSSDLAEEVASADADEGKYVIAFNDAVCTVSEEIEDNGERCAFAVCSFSGKEDNFNSEKIDSLLNKLNNKGAAAAPVMVEEEDAVGFISRFDLERGSENDFVTWLSFLERICVGSDDNIRSQADKGNAGLCLMFKNGGIGLDGDGERNFWSFEFPSCKVFLECDLSNGNARLRSLVSGEKQDLEQKRNLLRVNAQLQGQGYLTVLNSLVWYCTPILIYADMENNLAEDYLTKLFSCHVSATQDFVALFKKLSGLREAAEKMPSVSGYSDYLQV